MPSIPLKKISVWRESLYRALANCESGNCTHGTGAIEVMPSYSEKGVYQLIDGHHRLIEFLLTRKHIETNNTIPVKINKKEWARQYYSIASGNDRWQFNPNKKYGNLEDLADEEYIDDIVEDLFSENIMPLSLEQLFEAVYPEETVGTLGKIVKVPNPLFHGTTIKFNKFDLSKIGKRDSGNLGTGIYLSTKASIAMQYAEENTKYFGSGAPVVLEVKHSLQRVADFGDLIPYFKKVMKIAFPPSGNEMHRSSELRDWFVKNNYDAARAGHEIVVFDTNKLKILGPKKTPSSQERREQIYRDFMKKKSESIVSEQNNLGSLLVELLNENSFTKIINTKYRQDELRLYKKAVGKTIRGVAKVYNVIKIGPQKYSIEMEKVLPFRGGPKGSEYDKGSKQFGLAPYIAVRKCLDTSGEEAEMCADVDDLSDDQYEIALKFIGDVRSAIKFFETDADGLDNNPTNYGFVQRNGRPELVFIDFGHG